MASLSVGDLVPQLANLALNSPTWRPLGLGGQNFTHCCLRAVNSSLSVENGNLSFAETSFFSPDLSISSLEAAIDNDDFPCGASWDGDPAGSPIVQVPYTWCTSQCPGWEISHFRALSQWVGPLVQFILPSMAFCLNVPRARKLAIPDFVFQAHPRSLGGLTSYWLRLVGAMLLMALDTTVWMSICFAFAGPMLLSAVYEFVLDRKILEFLRPHEKKGRRPVIPGRTKAQLLLAVVVGNVRISTSLAEIRRSTSLGGGDTPTGDPETPTPRNPNPVSPPDSTWDRVMTMVDEYEKSRANRSLEAEAVSLPTKLKALLSAQASFGSTVGAPILFFVGGFIFTVIDIQNSLGDNDSAHALAFGMWWMTIPYLATVSCAMLASNSSSVLQGIVYDGGSQASSPMPIRGFWTEIKSRLRQNTVSRRILERLDDYQLIEHTYEGRFQTVTMWNRGPNKRRWVHGAIKEYSRLHGQYVDRNSAGGFLSPAALRDGLRMSFGDRWNVFWGTFFLLLVPSLLAFLTSYNTPRKVLSCRSINYVVYVASQLVAMACWVWEVRLKVRYGARWSDARTRTKALNWWCQAFVGLFGVFAAVGGTLMQILGVYRSCPCRIPMSLWLKPDDARAYIILSTNTADSIQAAQEWWTVTGTVAVVFLSVVCALAWWHQRRLRKLFRDEAESMESDWTLLADLQAAPAVSVSPDQTVNGLPKA